MKKTKNLKGGIVVHEDNTSKFISSPQKTVHKRREVNDKSEDGVEYDPICGQKLGQNSLWSGVDAGNEAEAVLKYNLKPCQNCFEDSYDLNRYRRKIHSNVVTHNTEIPDKYEKYVL